MKPARHPALERIAAQHGEAAFDLLCSLSGTDATAVLLEVARRRANSLAPKDVLAQYERDRFVRPSSLNGRRMIETELLALDSIGEEFEAITLSPLAPLGSHSVIAGVHQHRIVSTTRGSEVAADPTNGLTLEVALRRRDLLRATPRSAKSVNLACVQRVTRAQMFEGPMSYAHFSLLGMAIAGRDTGNRAFERTALVRLLGSMSSVVRNAGADQVLLSFTDFEATSADLLSEVIAELSGSDVHAVIDEERTAGRGYYPSVCFKVRARFGDTEIEVGDGGLVPWTQCLLANSKERLLIGGIGLERLAAMSAAQRR